jgi:uncharacterized protein
MLDINRDFVEILSSRLREDLNFMQVLLGPRQVGKTTGVLKVLETWAGESHFATADKLTPPDVNWIELQWQIAQSKIGPTVLVLDEIQKIPGWDEKIKLLYDSVRSERRLRVVILGSASTSIQKGLSESLAGRFELIKIPHWTFSESQKAFDWDLNHYLMFGGYPAPAEYSEDTKRWQSIIRDTIIEPVLSRDIQGLVQINKPALFRQSFELALSYPAQEISLQKLLGQLQDKGNVTTIRHYLTLFEGAFLIKTIDKYSEKKIVERRSSPKILPLCPALVHAHIDPLRIMSDQEWYGRIFELAIGAHLSNFRDGRLYYWRNANAEVDYIFTIEDKLFAIEVKSGRKKIVTGLGIFCSQFKNAIPVVIDRQKGEEFLKLNTYEEIINFLSLCD